MENDSDKPISQVVGESVAQHHKSDILEDMEALATRWEDRGDDRHAKELRLLINQHR